MHIVDLLARYKYFLLFPLAVVEGPIIAVIAGFLCIEGFLDIFLVFPIIVLGDVTGDSGCYVLGRWGMPPFLRRFGRWMGLGPEKLARVKGFFDAHPVRTIFLSKITLGIGVAGIYMAGNSRVPYRKFLGICLGTSAFQYIFYLGLGLLFGDAYMQIGRYMNFAAAFTIVAAFAVLLFFLIQSKLRKL